MLLNSFLVITINLGDKRDFVKKYNYYRRPPRVCKIRLIKNNFGWKALVFHMFSAK